MKTERKECSFKELIGKTIVKITKREDRSTVDDDPWEAREESYRWKGNYYICPHEDYKYDNILFFTECGKRYSLRPSPGHSRDVKLNPIEGDLNNLLSKPILIAYELLPPAPGKNEEKDEDGKWNSCAFYKMNTNKGGVTMQWFSYASVHCRQAMQFYELHPDPSPDKYTSVVDAYITVALEEEKKGLGDWWPNFIKDPTYTTNSSDASQVKEIVKMVMEILTYSYDYSPGFGEYNLPSFSEDLPGLIANLGDQFFKIEEKENP